MGFVSFDKRPQRTPHDFFAFFLRGGPSIFEEHRDGTYLLQMNAGANRQIPVLHNSESSFGRPPFWAPCEFAGAKGKHKSRTPKCGARFAFRVPSAPKKTCAIEAAQILVAVDPLQQLELLGGLVENGK